MAIGLTIILLVVAITVTAAANLLSRRPPRLERIWYPPYDGIQFIGILVILNYVRPSHNVADGQAVRRAPWPLTRRAPILAISVRTARIGHDSMVSYLRREGRQ